MSTRPSPAGSARTDNFDCRTRCDNVLGSGVHEHLKGVKHPGKSNGAHAVDIGEQHGRVGEGVVQDERVVVRTGRPSVVMAMGEPAAHGADASGVLRVGEREAT